MAIGSWTTREFSPDVARGLRRRPLVESIMLTVGLGRQAFAASGGPRQDVQCRPVAQRATH